MFFKKIKNTNSDKDIKKSLEYIVFCIWGDGPGRPYDNAYIIKDREIDNNHDFIRLLFNGGEECIIEQPRGINWGPKGIKINKAKKVIWKYYFYGKPQSIDTLIIMEYTLIDDSNVHVVVKGNYFNRDEIININGKIAIDSF